MTTPYLVLARKYRPQRFQDLTGQEHVVRTLVNALKTGRVAHAFLFTGPRGCGKTTSARILARALNCQKGPTPEPCGVCGPCVDIAAGTDVDVQEIDAASNNGVDDVRALREAAKYLPARDRYKIYIVDEVHMLSGPAFNALLKTLEEPPGHIKFLLATTDPQKLPATILSRVQRHNFQLVPLGKIVTRLREIAQAEGVPVADELAAHARNLVLATLPAVRQELPDHELRELQETSHAHEPAQLARVFELLQDAEDEVAKATTPRHALEVALLRAVHLAPSGSLPELVEKVDRAFAKLGGERVPPAASARLQREVVSSARTAIADPKSNGA